MKTIIAPVLTVFVIALALAIENWQTDAESVNTDGQIEAIKAAIAENEEISAQRAGSSLQAQASSDLVERPEPRQASEADFTLFQPTSSAQPTYSEPSPAHVWLDPSISINQVAAAAAKSGRGWAFGWIQVESGFEREQLRKEWSDHGAMVLDFSGTYARTRLPESRVSLQALAAHPAILGMGIQPTEDKIAPDLLTAEDSTASEIPVLIGLMDDDPDEVWRTELEARGAVVGDWFAHARAYSANVQPAEVLDIAEADFVSTIEPVKVVRTLLDTAVTVMGADGLRTYNPSAGSFSGTIGASASVGFADSGLNIFHQDIAGESSQHLR